MTICAGLWGSFTVKACVWSVGSCAKNLDVSLTVTSHARAPTLGGKRAILNTYDGSVIDHGAIETLLCTIPEGTPTRAPSDPFQHLTREGLVDEVPQGEIDSLLDGEACQFWTAKSDR